MEFLKKFLSRKFLLALAAFIAVLTGVLSPEMEEQAATTGTSLAEAIAIAAPLVYILIEGIRDIKAKP